MSIRRHRAASYPTTGPTIGGSHIAVNPAGMQIYSDPPDYIWIVITGQGKTGSGSVASTPTGSANDWSFAESGLTGEITDYWIGGTVTFTSGTLNGTTANIIGWDGTKLTIDSTSSPANSDTFTISDPYPCSWKQVVRAQQSITTTTSTEASNLTLGGAQQGAWLMADLSSDLNTMPAYELNGNTAVPAGTIKRAWWDPIFGGLVFDSPAVVAGSVVTAYQNSQAISANTETSVAMRLLNNQGSDLTISNPNTTNALLNLSPPASGEFYRIEAYVWLEIATGTWVAGDYLYLSISQFNISTYSSYRADQRKVVQNVTTPGGGAGNDILTAKVELVKEFTSFTTISPRIFCSKAVNLSNFPGGWGGGGFYLSANVVNIP